jgi:outer membrane protein
MRRAEIGVLVLLLLILLGMPLFADQITKVGILDIEKVYSIYFRESKAVKELQQMRADVLREINRIDEEVLLLESQKLDAENRGDGQAALRLDREIFEKKQYRDDYRRIKMDQIRKRSENLYQSDEFLDELLQAIEYVAESEGFSLVLNSSGQYSQFFFYYTKEVDITELVIQELMRRAGQSYDGQ